MWKCGNVEMWKFENMEIMHSCNHQSNPSTLRQGPQAQGPNAQKPKKLDYDTKF